MALRSCIFLGGYHERLMVPARVLIEGVYDICKGRYQGYYSAIAVTKNPPNSLGKYLSPYITVKVPTPSSHSLHCSSFSGIPSWILTVKLA